MIKKQHVNEVDDVSTQCEHPRMLKIHIVDEGRIMAGEWWLGTRGGRPRLWDKWTWIQLETYGPDSVPGIGDLVKMLRWAEQGQHVKLEFVPDGTYRPTDGPPQGE
jgi:hypothetical protein